MMEKKLKQRMLEKKLKQRMLDESEPFAQMKDDMWRELEAEMDKDTQRTPDPISERSEMRSRRTNRSRQKRRPTMGKIAKWTTGAAVVALAATVFLSMPAGTAFMEELRLWLAPEKKVEIDIEGSKEETQQELHLNEESHYAIYYDVDRYKLEQEEGKDIIMTKEPMPAQYPEVSFVIEQNRNVLPEQAVEQVATELKRHYAEVREVEVITKPFMGFRVSAIEGQEWDSKVTYVYVTDNGKQGSFVLSLNYFLEAAEGHGARFSQMLDEFRVVEGE